MDRRLPFSNRYVFAKVMQDNPDLCKELIERVLGVEIEEIVAIETESEETTVMRRGVRFDVYLKTSGAAFEVEMQTYQQADLPLRMRYYRSQLDRRLLNRGQAWDKLVPVYVVFICTHDPFGRGLPVYTFRSTCAEDPEVAFENGALDIVLSAAGDLSLATPEVAGLLQYVATGRDADDEFARRLDQAVGRAYDDERWVEDMDLIEMDILDAKRAAAKEARAEAIVEGLAEGRAKGLAEGRAKGLAEGRAEGRAEGLAEHQAEQNAIIAAMEKAGCPAAEILDVLKSGDEGVAQKWLAQAQA